jgi:hypothetical protein
MPAASRCRCSSSPPGVGLALLWRDPTFPRDQLWRREQLLTWLRGPLGLALGAGTLVRLGRWFVTGG